MKELIYTVKVFKYRTHTYFSGFDEETLEELVIKYASNDKAIIKSIARHYRKMKKDYYITGNAPWDKAEVELGYRTEIEEFEII